MSIAQIKVQKCKVVTVFPATAGTRLLRNSKEIGVTYSGQCLESQVGK